MSGFISGLRNYHKVGMNGYIIRKRQSEHVGMLRIIHTVGNGLSTLHKSDGDFNFAPHNHRQDIRLIGLMGTAYNVTFNFNPRLSGHFGHEYRFDSELVEGKMGVHWHGCGDLDIDDISPITAEGIGMESQAIHTIIAEPGAAWIIDEGDLATLAYPQHKNLCYSKRGDFKLETTHELYQPMTQKELEQGWDLLGGLLSGVEELCSAAT